MLTQHIALVPEEEGLDPSELARVSAALQKQVTGDLLPLWKIAATVDAFPALEDVPVGYWPIILTRCELGNHGRIHLDRSGQPYAQVQLRPLWSFAASRSCLEMLVNPFETRSVSGPSLRSDQGPVEFLVEVCAPCEDPRNAYVIDGVLVSDFCTPAFFSARAHEAERYTFRGMRIAALRPESGGHMTWYDPISDSFWLRHHWSDNPLDTKLGPVDRKVISVRELVHACTPPRPMPELRASMELENAQRERASQRRAQQLRALLGKPYDRELEAAIDAVRMDLPPVILGSAPFAIPAAAKPAPSRTQAPLRSMSAEGSTHFEDGEFEDIDTLMALDDEVTEVEERSQRAPKHVPVRPLADVPALPTEVSRPAAPSGPHPAPALNQDAAREPSSQPPSIAPVSLGSLEEKTESRAKAPIVAGLAAAAVLAVVWSAATNNGSPSSETSAQVARSAAAAPPPSPASVAATPVASPAAPLAVVPEASVPALAPTLPAPAAPQPRAAAQPAPRAKLRAAPASEAANPARAARAASAPVKPVYDLPLPRREATRMDASRAATAALDTLIEDRR